MDPTKCFICEKSFTVSEAEFVGKGIPALIAASKSRKDGKHEQLQNVEIIQVHKSCKLEYTNKESIKLLLRQSKEEYKRNEEKSLELDFDFKSNCIFCGKDTKRERKAALERRRFVHEFTSAGTKEKIMETALKRNDELGRQVLDRIKNINLVSVKARYHKDCNNKFFRPLSKVKKGRPVDKTLDGAFEKVCDFINSSEERQFTLKSLLEKVEYHLPNEGTMSMKTLKTKLEKKYGDGIVFAISFIKPSVIYFLDSGMKEREEMVKQNKVKLPAEET